MVADFLICLSVFVAWAVLTAPLAILLGRFLAGPPEDEPYVRETPIYPREEFESDFNGFIRERHAKGLGR